ncbi:MAG: DUF1989 domain-containing protein [Solirubrobacterales bacterium]
MSESPTPPGNVVDDVTVDARAGWSGVVAAGNALRIVDIEGKQGVDFLAYDASDYTDRYAAADTMKINGGIYLTTGNTLYSINCNPLMTIIDDTCGQHDTIAGCCSDAINRTRYDAPGQQNCRQNFLDEFAKWGMDERDMVANLNFFCNVPVGPDGAMDFQDPTSVPGDYIDLRADRDVLAVISNCPQINNPAAGFNPSPLQVTIWEPG